MGQDRDADAANLTEAERIEFNRRIDIAKAVIPAAKERLKQKIEMDESLATSIKNTSSFWYWVTAAIGAAVHYYFPGKDFLSDFGLLLIVATGVHWLDAHRRVELLRQNLSECKQQLELLFITWQGAIGGEEGFWNIGSYDVNDKAYRDWWFGWNESILMRVRRKE